MACSLLFFYLVLSNPLPSPLRTDVDNDGSISRSDLALSLHTLFDITLTNPQLNSLCTTFGITSTSARVEYGKFVDVVRDVATSQPLTSSAYGSGSDLHTGDWSDRTFARLGIVNVPEGARDAEVLEVIARKIRSRQATSSATQVRARGGEVKEVKEGEVVGKGEPWFVEREAF